MREWRKSKSKIGQKINKTLQLTAVLRNAGFCSSKSHQVVLRTEFCVIHAGHETRAAQSRAPSNCLKTNQFACVIRIPIFEKYHTSNSQKCIFNI